MSNDSEKLKYELGHIHTTNPNVSQIQNMIMKTTTKIYQCNIFSNNNININVKYNILVRYHVM